ncbi:HAMP domain-containing protein [Saccharopolyspora sp. S2-29]|uniref:histidine kinase n=1 Tax=Saccharopolyspora mangrovi TaxID=3082379 RepID=A0ABU6AKJ6_9PSEU|nr:HAMP domain-containing protein [Saccharopolyspora sp. S2-29]MEB3372072.1 HAMP domain-containing protein [Saccharopolyspora sp. S2-29]
MSQPPERVEAEQVLARLLPGLRELRDGNFRRRLVVSGDGAAGEAAAIYNEVAERNQRLAGELQRVGESVARGQLPVAPVSLDGPVEGGWALAADSVNFMADNLTSQVRDIAQVATAVAAGDLTQKIDVDAQGEILQLKNTINTMVDQLSAFAAEVTRVAREVGTEGKLGGQARVYGVAGIWKDLTDNVNIMADNLTNQVRSIAQVTTAVAQGDLSKKIDVNARGEILELKTTINTMVDQLSAFAAEVTRVAREVGTEGQLGGQAEVADVSGTWRRLTESVNRLAGNLTTQVRAIAQVATAVTEGDLTRQITVDASGEVAELKDNINAMISNLKETTRANQEQDWLKTNLARISALMQGQHDLDALAQLIMSELAPLVSAHQGAFFLTRTEEDGHRYLEHVAGYGRPPERQGTPLRFDFGESLVGQVAVDRRSILVEDAPPDYTRISSGLGEAAPTNVAIVPVLFEGAVLGVIELAGIHRFSSVHLDLLDRLKESIGVEVNTIVVNTRTEALLGESQHLASELQARSEQLQNQQDELQHSNTELEEKAALLASRNKDIELKNIEIEQARQELEDRARQLSEASAYKSEFLANMSHELRTPLNSVLILAKLLADNMDGNLTPQQVDLARTVHQAGSDLLQLINDVLDLSKVEAGQMHLLPEDVEIGELARSLESMYRPVAAEKGLEFKVVVAPSLPPSVHTDRSKLEQIVRNLLANAVKFTDRGTVEMRIRPAQPTEVNAGALRRARQRVVFAVRDTGIGIPADKLSLIFEAFQQVDGTTVRKYGGTGLGLSISRELTTLLGGELQVHSEPGQGSTFSLYLPTEPISETPAPPVPTKPVIEEPPETGEEQEEPAPAEAAPLPRPPTEAETSLDVSVEGIDPPLRSSELMNQETQPHLHRAVQPAQRGALQFNSEKVLVVDDDERSVHAMRVLLEQHGLQVVQADNALAALKELRNHADIVIVLMDVMMPQLDGNETIRMIREMPRYRDLTIIAVTAKAMKGDREQSIAAGATEYLTKPVDSDRLFDLLSEHLPAGMTSEVD